MIRSVYAIILISSLLGFLYTANKAMSFGGGYLHFGLLFVFPILCTVAWYFMVKDNEGG
tara:strand:+ start:96 stop:272 length:177 start_codon:yes stop_codon:yes gene_type:complete